MERIVDNVARILAAPLPRREALRRIMTLLGAAAVWGVAGRQDVLANGSCSSCCTVDQGKSVCPPNLCCCVKLDPPNPRDKQPKGNSQAACAFGTPDFCPSATPCCGKGNCL